MDTYYQLISLYKIYLYKLIIIVSMFFYALLLLFKMQLTIIFSILAFISSEINIHIIPHTHLDVGWIHTIEEYRLIVNQIFNTVVEDLKSNLERTFVFSEMEFFSKWYYSTSPEVKILIKQWLKEKRIEFVGGGITMNDEGNAYFEDIISNYKAGFQFLSNEFGIQPETGWFLDPFGHTAGNAHVASKLGYKQIVLGRIDKDDLANRIKEKTLEFNWKPFDNDKVFTHLLPFHYGNTQTFAAFFSYIQSNIKQATVPNWVINSIPHIKTAMKGLKHNHFLFLVGDDFTYTPNHKMFRNIELYMSYLNTNTYINMDKTEEKINVFYSTPSRYFADVRRTVAKSAFDTQFDIDFVPYSCQGNTFWSGYYTSRPYLKGKIRSIANMYLVSSKLITELLIRSAKIERKEINQLLNVIGIVQHHDIITGTSPERVNSDYISIIQPVLQKVYERTLHLIQHDYLNVVIDKICLSNPIVDFGCRNEFSLINKEDGEMVIGLFNPIIEGKLLISLEFVNSINTYEVYDLSNNLIQSDFYCIEDDLFKYNNTCFMNFFYSFNKDIELTSFKLKNKRIKSQKACSFPKEKITLTNLSNKIRSFTFDPISLSYSLTLLDDIVSIYNFSLSHSYYEGYSLKACEYNYINHDGAYIFAPCQKEYTLYNVSLFNSYIYKGDIGFVTVIRLDSSFIISTLFYYPCFMKVESIMDPIKRMKGINFALLLKSDINNTVILPNRKGTIINSTEFWTDSNGIKMLRRITNHRDTFDYNENQTIAGNFYPVVESISIREKASQVYQADKYNGLSVNDRMISIFTDRPQSGGVLKQGEVIILINRASVKDDEKGMNEPLYEEISMKNYFKVQHIIMFGRNIYNSNENELQPQQFMYNFFHNTPILFNSLQSHFFQSYSVLSQLFVISNNIITNYYFLIENRIEIQFYCKYDYYYQTSIKYDDKTSYFGLIAINVKGHNVEIDGEYIGLNDYLKAENMIKIKSSKRFFIKLGANDIYILTIKFLA